MIDFHSHILPGMDDGSKSVEESVAMLQALQSQCVDVVVATSHYYAHRESPEAFLRRREAALHKLSERVPEGMQILPGAEVLYYEGIGRLPQLRELCIQGTDVLLLEMPESTWTEHMIREVLHLAGTMQVVIAHVERPAPKQSAKTLERLRQRGVLMQSNAGNFLGFFSGRKACSMIKKGQIHLLGSDCHNLTTRPPRMAEACRVIVRRCGGAALRHMQELGRDLLFADQAT